MSPITVDTKYGKLEVRFNGERVFTEHSFEGACDVVKQAAYVQNPEGVPLTINGIQYVASVNVVYGERWSRDERVTDWHYAPGEYPYIYRKTPGGNFLGEPTAKARQVIRALMLEAAAKAHEGSPAILDQAEADRLDRDAARAEAEAQEAAKLMQQRRNEAHIMRSQAQSIRARLNPQVSA